MNRTLLFLCIIFGGTNLCFGNKTIPNLSPAIKNAIMFERLFELYTFQTRSKLSEKCHQQIKIYQNKFKTDKWAFKMLDASSKFQTGLMGFNIYDLGNFDQCIGIESAANKIKGKYCLLQLQMELDLPEIELTMKTVTSINNDYVNQFTRLITNDQNEISGMKSFLKWALCIPDGCTAQDVVKHVNKFFSPLKHKSIAKLTENDCQTIDTQMKLDVGDWIVISLGIVILVIIFLNTLYDSFLHYTSQKSAHKLLTAFSLVTNTKRLITLNTNPDLLPCLDGIRVLSLLWIIQGHTYMMSLFRPEINTGFMFRDWIFRFWSLSTIYSQVSTDTFLLLSGLLVMYSFMKARSRKIPFNVPVMYLHRYLRLTPALLAVILVYCTVYDKIGSGPQWTGNYGDSCRQYWWSSLLYIQNYVNKNHLCVDQTWYLQVDMQMFLLSPLLLISMVKWPRTAQYQIISLFIINCIVSFSVAWSKHYLLPFSNTSYMPDFYEQTYVRAGPYILGIGLGMLLYETKHKHIQINKFIAIGLWIVSLSIMFYSIFGAYPLRKVASDYGRFYQTVYVGLRQNIWSIGLVWIIFACIKGYSGPINWFLSLPIFQFVSKLTYCMYLTHQGVIQMLSSSVRIPTFFSDFNILLQFFSILCLVLLISTVWYLAFEAPFAVIDSYLVNLLVNLTRNKSNQKPDSDLKELTENR